MSLEDAKAVSQKEKRAKRQQAAAQSRAERVGRAIAVIAPDEEPLAPIGNSYTQNLLGSFEFERSRAMLTKRRVYYSGKRFLPWRLAALQGEGVVSVEDISYTVFSAAATSCFDSRDPADHERLFRSSICEIHPLASAAVFAGRRLLGAGFPAPQRLCWDMLFRR